ncbi:MAG: efflux RND transporter periplasmic adaptor subunit [Bacteriovoracaceae bacterium]|nr:efflux RND transporter periplasmic adaptor subunit [Bacteriovoracaceae bacterium]
MKKKLILLLVILGIAGTAIYFWKKTKNPILTYREIKVEKGNIDLTILATGTVQPKNRLEIKPPISGRIDQVLVDEGQKVKKGQILAWMSSTERAALLDAARSQGEAELKRWEELYRSTPVMAPIAGTIISRNVESGQTFTNTESILVMSDHLIINAQVDETDMAEIKLKQPAQIILDAYSKETIPALVDQIAFEAKTVNNVTTYIVDVLPLKTPDFMRSGMTANVTFLIQSKKDILIIPTDSVLQDDHKNFVWVQNSKTEDSAEKIKKELLLGISDGKHTEVIDGLKEGDIIFSLQIDTSAQKSKLNNSPFSPMRNRPRK